MMLRYLGLSCLFSWLMMASMAVCATASDRVTIDQAIREAGLIFQGTVIKIESRNAKDMGENYAEEYYAFVTFRIDKLIKGDVEGNSNTMTLPFESCLTANYTAQQDLRNHKSSGIFRDHQPAVTEHLGDVMACSISGMPQFTVGETDILFTPADIASASCPLIGWGQGRFSIVDNKIYPVTWLNPDGAIDFTAPYELEEEQEAERRGEKIPQAALKLGWSPAKGAKRLTLHDFIYFIEKSVRQVEQANFKTGKLPSAPVKSADFNDPYYYRGAKWEYEQQQRINSKF